jgi:hypothetical protein
MPWSSSPKPPSSPPRKSNTWRRFSLVYKRISETLSSPEFAERHRVNEKAFTRERKLPLPQLVKYLLNLRKGANQDELDRFFEVVCDQPLADSVSKSALTQARAKLRADAFAELNDVLVDGAMNGLPMRRWHGFRLLAVDGSSFLLPKEPAIVEAFGQTGEVTPQARFSRLYDVLNRVIVSADIEPLSVGERILAGEYLPSTRADDLLLYDRGYPAFWLFAAHAEEQRHFCARLPRAFCAEVQAFAAGTARSQVISLSPCDEARRQCRAFGLPAQALRLRLIRVRLKGGEEELLITSLLDEETFPTHLFKHLYHLRWGIEEGYKKEKSWAEVENFSGRTVHALKQDVLAKVLTLNLTAILVWVAQWMTKRLYQARRREYQVNFANALSKIKDNVVRLLGLEPPPGLLERLVCAMAQEVEAIRPDRSFPRDIKSSKPKRFHPNYKRCR